MKITTTVKTMSPAQALERARGGGNALGHVMYGGQDITLRLMYLESKEVILRLHYQPAPLMRWLGVQPKGPDSQLIRMIVEGTRCTASYSENPLNTEEIEVDEGDLQKTEFSEEKMIQTAKRPALRMVRRQIGRVATAEVHSIRSIYRPYYVAFYGELKMGTKVRYLPIAADGNTVERSV